MELKRKKERLIASAGEDCEPFRVGQQLACQIRLDPLYCVGKVLPTRFVRVAAAWKSAIVKVFTGVPAA